MSKVIAFTAPFAVYKATVQKGRKTACLWAGYLADRATRKVVWDDGTMTEYGATTTEDAAFYSDACLSPWTWLKAGLCMRRWNGSVECYYGKPVHIKKPWLTWLEGCIQASKITGKLFHSGFNSGSEALPAALRHCRSRVTTWHFLLHNN